MRSVASQHPRLLRVVRMAAVLGLLLAVLAGLMFTYESHRYNRIVDRRLAHTTPLAARSRFRVVGRVAHPVRPLMAASLGTHPIPRSVPVYDALPPQLVQAVVAIEDRQFFEHSGINYLRTARCAMQDTFTLHITCGGSTLTQQLARIDFLSSDKTFQRKAAEFIIARRLEHRLTKQQIFAMYAAQINLGQQGPIAVKGFRQAARVYLGKDLRQLDLAECALLAGIIHAPNFDNPYRHPDRAAARRNVVLKVMAEIGVITRTQADAARAEPLHLADTIYPGTIFGLDPSMQS